VTASCHVDVGQGKSNPQNLNRYSAASQAWQWFQALFKSSQLMLKLASSIAAARLPLRSDPAESQFDRPSAHGLIMFSTGCLLTGTAPSSTWRFHGDHACLKSRSSVSGHSQGSILPKSSIEV
jgi:hypothetical protein